MRILICDDDPLMVEQLHNYIEFYFEHHHIKCPEIVSFSCGEDLLADNGEKDLVFLDIEMPGVNGIYVGNELKKQNKNILIFVVTSYAEYLDDAMRFHVFRYLSKPLDRQRLFRNLDDALAQYHASSKKIAFETKDGFHTLMPSSIVMIEAISKKSVLYTTAKTYHTVHPMQYWLETLPQAQFFRTHRSFIVNMEHVSDFDHSLVYMDVPETNAYLTQRKYHDFKEAYLLFLESMR